MSIKSLFIFILKQSQNHQKLEITELEGQQNKMTCIEYKDYKDHFKVIRKVGDGNCASVLKVQDTRTKKQYALKYSKLDCPVKLALALQEIEVVRSLDHPTAIEIYYYFVNNGTVHHLTPQNIELGIIMELADRSLEQDIFLRRKKDAYYTEDEVNELLKQLLPFFAHAQQKGYLHRDIKPANILIMHSNQSSELSNSIQGKFKVCDFGFAIKNHEYSDKNIAGTASYASPKILSKFQNSQIFVQGNNYKDDVYSLGITLLELCTLQSPERLSPKNLLLRTNNRYGLPITSLLKSMVEFDENKRPDFLQLQQILPRYLSKRELLINNLNRNVEKSRVLPALKSIGDGLKDRDSDLPISERHLKQNQTACSSFAIQNLATEEKKKDNFEIAKTDEFLSKVRDILLNEKKVIKDEENINNRNLTPRAHKDLEDRKENTEKIVLSSPNEKGLGRAKTKRKSKLINNNSLQCLATKGICQDLNSKPKQAKKAMEEVELSPRVEELNSFTINLKIKQLEVIQLTGLESGNQRNIKMMLWVNVGTKLYVTFNSWRHYLKQIRLGEKSMNIQFIKYISKKQQLAIVGQSGAVGILPLASIFKLISEPDPIINIPRLRNALIQNMLAPLRVVEMSIWGTILKGYHSGCVTENDQLILETNYKGKISFVQRLQDSIFVVTREGVISKFKLKQNGVSTSNNMLAYYNCKSSIIQFSIDFQSKESQPILTIVTTTGFVFRLDSNLSNQKVKRISPHCLRACSINNRFDSGRRILAADSQGNILNELGFLVHPSHLASITELRVFDKGRKLVLSTEEGRVSEIVLPVNVATF